MGSYTFYNLRVEKSEGSALGMKLPSSWPRTNKIAKAAAKSTDMKGLQESNPPTNPRVPAHREEVISGRDYVRVVETIWEEWWGKRRLHCSGDLKKAVENLQIP